MLLLFHDLIIGMRNWRTAKYLVTMQSVGCLAIETACIERANQRKQLGTWDPVGGRIL